MYQNELEIHTTTFWEQIYLQKTKETLKVICVKAHNAQSYKKIF